MFNWKTWDLKNFTWEGNSFQAWEESKTKEVTALASILQPHYKMQCKVNWEVKTVNKHINWLHDKVTSGKTAVHSHFVCLSELCKHLWRVVGFDSFQIHTFTKLWNSPSWYFVLISFKVVSKIPIYLTKWQTLSKPFLQAFACTYNRRRVER